MRRACNILIIICLGVFVGCSADDSLENSDIIIGNLVVEEAVDAAAEYERHICVMEFTGQWCQFCPAGYDVLNLAVNGTKDYPSKYKDIGHIIALHDNSAGEDEFAAPLQDVQLEIYRDFNLDGYPSAVVDLMTGLSLSGGDLEEALEKALAEPAGCGIAVESEYKDGKAEVKVKLAVSKNDSYRVAMFVVEDPIIAKQSTPGVLREDYHHRHVARRMLSSRYVGESMGTLEAGMQVSRTYTFPVEPEWNLENTEIYALAINGREQINNVAVCKIDGGNMDYNYKK